MEPDEVRVKVNQLREDMWATGDAIAEECRLRIAAAEGGHMAAIDRLLFAHGKVRCPECRGKGAVARLDSGVMRRFGFREWDGCKACGGEGENRGRGYA